MQKKKNKSFYYLFPLIDGWNVNSTMPANTFAINEYDNSLIAKYPGGSKVLAGEELGHLDGFVYFVHKIAEEFLPDYHLIIKGEYSKISDSAKLSIISRAMSISDSSYVSGVLRKSPKIKRDLEQFFGLSDIDKFSNEYEGKMFEEEIFKSVLYDRDEESVEVQ